MLRILPLVTREDGSNVAVTQLRLVGKISGRWVAELQQTCIDALKERARLEIDLSEVSFVDADGLRFLESLPSDRVSLVNCALFVAEQLKSRELGHSR